MTPVESMGLQPLHRRDDYLDPVWGWRNSQDPAQGAVYVYSQISSKGGRYWRVFAFRALAHIETDLPKGTRFPTERAALDYVHIQLLMCDPTYDGRLAP